MLVIRFENKKNGKLSKYYQYINVSIILDFQKQII